MAEYTNSTLNSSDWELYFQPSPYSECLVISEECKFNKRIQNESGAHVGYLDELVCLYAGL